MIDLQQASGARALTLTLKACCTLALEKNLVAAKLLMHAKGPPAFLPRLMCVKYEDLWGAWYINGRARDVMSHGLRT
jgi:hypothetical protein